MPQTCYQPAVRDAARFLAGLCSTPPSAERLSSLLYLADRLSIRTYWHTISEDRFGCREGVPHGVGTRRAATSLTRRGTLNDHCALDTISEASEAILKAIHDEYKERTDAELIETMRRLPEAGQDGPMSYLALAGHLSPDDPRGLADALETDRSLRWCFDGVRC
jgi:hypothetical protein|nr:hypothetical protein [Neorhizobium tomejilense]